MLLICFNSYWDTWLVSGRRDCGVSIISTVSLCGLSSLLSTPVHPRRDLSLSFSNPSSFFLLSVSPVKEIQRHSRPSVGVYCHIYIYIYTGANIALTQYTDTNTNGYIHLDLCTALCLCMPSLCVCRTRIIYTYIFVCACIEDAGATDETPKRRTVPLQRVTSVYNGVPLNN